MENEMNLDQVKEVLQQASANVASNKEEYERIVKDWKKSYDNENKKQPPKESSEILDIV